MYSIVRITHGVRERCIDYLFKGMVNAKAKNSRYLHSSNILCSEKNDTHSNIEPIEQERNKSNMKKPVNPFNRVLGILSDDITGYFGIGKYAASVNETSIENQANTLNSEQQKNLTNKHNEDDENISAKMGSSSSTAQHSTRGEGTGQSKAWPSHCDVLVVGGGAVGSSVAYHLKERALQGLSVVVVEQDSSYERASTVLSVGGIRQQFSVPENIQLSLYGMDFLRDAPRLLGGEGLDPPDMQFNPGGYLTLASPAGVQTLKENFDIQREVGAKVDFLSASRLQQRFPWLNVDGVEAGVIGRENEGWFDPWSLLLSVRRKAAYLGAEYVSGRVTALDHHLVDDMVTEAASVSAQRNLRCAEVTLPSGEKQHIKFAILVVAAGAWSGEVGRLVGIGQGSGIMGVPIPVEPRKRYVYCVHAPDGPGLDCPLVIDPNGTYFRREGLRGLYLCGQSPAEDQEPSVHDLEVDYDFFDNNVWPTIAHRVSAFENLKVQSAWAGYYDYNTFDQNGIIGIHPIFSNMFIATGFSGHGIQQAPGVGRAVMEMILHGEFRTINLERFGFDRVLLNEPLFEKNIV